MNNLKFATILIFCSVCLQAQRWDVFETWPNEQLIRIDELTQHEALSKNERQILFLINLARADGNLFEKTVLQRFIDSVDYKSNRYLVSLKEDLRKTKKLPPLRSDSLLQYIAISHASRMGENGTVGHDGFSDRYAPALIKATMVAENCFYGPESALIIVAELLIDEGVSDVGHRVNILDPSFTHIGISVETHTEYGFNCVMSFAQYPD